MYFIDNETSDTLQLSVYVTQQNDIPDPFDVDSDPISTYNQNSYVWSADESTICEDEELEQGARVGMIRFGSRADLYFENYEPLVKVNQKTIAGETLIAKK